MALLEESQVERETARECKACIRAGEGINACAKNFGVEFKRGVEPELEIYGSADAVPHYFFSEPKFIPDSETFFD